MTFDPSKYGAKPLESFDPSKYDASDLTVTPPDAAASIWASSTAPKKSMAATVVDNIKSVPGQVFDLAKTITGTGAAGEDIATAIAGPNAQKNLEKIQQQKVNNIALAVEAIKKLKAMGKDTARSEAALQARIADSGMSITEIIPVLKKSNEQIAGDFAQLATAVAGAGEIPGTAKALAGTGGVLESTIAGAKAGARAGGIIGAGGGIATGLQNDGTAGDVALSAGIGGGLGALLGGVTGGTFGALAGKRVPAAQKQLNDALEITSPTLNKQESIASMESAGKPGGAQEPKLFGKNRPIPTKEDVNVAQSVADVVSANKSPEANIIATNKKITSTSEELSNHFEKNHVPTNFEDFRTYISKFVHPQSSLKADASAQQTYDRVKESLIKSVYNHLKDAAEKTGDFTSETDLGQLWKSRISIDKQIDEELKNTAGNSILETPQYLGAKAAAQDFRNAFNDYIAHSYGNPGEMAKINVMKEFINESRAKGIDVGNDTETMNQLRQSLGIDTPQEIADARAAIFEDKLKQLNLMYKARRNIAEANHRLAGKDVFTRYWKNHPVIAKTAKALGTALGIGAVTGAGIEATK